MKKLIIITAIVVMAGCGIWPTQEGFRQRLSLYLGAHVATVESELGFPDRKTEDYKGNPIYIYNRSRSYTSPVNATTTYSPGYGYGTLSAETRISGGGTYIDKCIVSLVINKSTKTVESFYIDGDGCTARPLK